MTVLEVGAGIVQPLARELGEERFLDDSVRTALIRVNPDQMQHSSVYQDELEHLQKLFHLYKHRRIPDA